MKNKTIAILFAVLLCAALCGCGMDRTGNRNDMDILPEVTPLISPDAEDGIVTDRDGIMGNGQTNGADKGDRDGAGMSSPSPSPNAGTGTGTSQKTGNGQGTGNGQTDGPSPSTQPNSTGR